MTSDNTLGQGGAEAGSVRKSEGKVVINPDITPWYIYAGIIAFGVAAPFLFPAYTTQIAFLWLMILFALTWDIAGGQMGYNSLGNIFFFGAGMYICAVVQVGMFTDVGTYTSARGGEQLVLDYGDYFFSLLLGTGTAAIVCVVFAIVLGRIFLGLRGPYFAIGTLGMALAARELAGTWEWIGGGSGIAMPVYPGQPHEKSVVFYIMFLALAVLTFIFLRWLYSTRFGLAINAIRDDEEKAEAMGIHTLRHKLVARGRAFETDRDDAPVATGSAHGLVSVDRVERSEESTRSEMDDAGPGPRAGAGEAFHRRYDSFASR